MLSVNVIVYVRFTWVIINLQNEIFGERLNIINVSEFYCESIIAFHIDIGCTESEFCIRYLCIQPLWKL